MLDRTAQSVDAGLDIHLVLDNYGTHWFAEITRKRIRRGTFRSVRDLIRAIQEYFRLFNKNPRPFQ